MFHLSSKYATGLRYGHEENKLRIPPNIANIIRIQKTKTLK